MFLTLKRKWFYPVLFLVALIAGTGIHLLPNQQPPVAAQVVLAQQSSTQQLVQQGIDSYSAGKYKDAIDLWQRALQQSLPAKDAAIIRNNLAQAYRQVGQLDQAIFQWEQAIQFYRTQSDSSSQQALSKLLIEQAQAYSSIGQQEQAVQLLESAVKIARNSQETAAEAAALGALGRAYLSQGDYDRALEVLQSSLTIAQRFNHSAYIATTLNLQGNTFTSRAGRYRYLADAARSEKDKTTETQYRDLAQKDIQAALNAYNQSLQLSRSLGGIAEARALLNLNFLLQKLNSQGDATPAQIAQLQANRSRTLEVLNQVPDSQEKAYALINLANGLMPQRSEQGQVESPEQVETLLRQAVAVTARIKDRRSESFALGTLARLYELQGQRQEAMQLSRQAQNAAQQVYASDSLYQWQWQMGRLLKAEHKPVEAIAAYRQAISTLQAIRGDILVASKDVQFDFRDAVEPLYRELIGLLLDADPNAVVPSLEGQPGAGNKQLAGAPDTVIGEALGTVELLKLAELQNFFGNECVQVALEEANAELYAQAGTKALPNRNLEAGTVLIYSIVLDQRTALILRSPEGALKLYWIPVGDRQLQLEMDTLRTLLEDRQTEEYLVQAQQMYDLLIRPLQKDLQSLQAHTLVFINDGVLRKIPMAALHDGQKFLVESYAIANTPSLSLTTRKPFDRSNLKTLVLGLTVEKPPFAALSNVSTEVKGLQSILPGTQLIDSQFTKSSMKESLEKVNYPLIHMATHGKFGIDASSTFLVTYEQPITISELDEVLRTNRSRQPIELLTLSACQTAAGDNRSALGIAGVAVQAGVRSALATLWYINDEATVPLIEAFYKELLKPEITKAEALRQAQLSLIRDRDYNHPAVWSPFILIGNWL